MSITSYPSAVAPWSGSSSLYLISDHETCLKEFSVMYFFLPPFPTNYSSFLSHPILPSISWSTSQSCCSKIQWNVIGKQKYSTTFFFISTLDGRKRSASHPEHFTGWERPPVLRYLEGFTWKTAIPTTLKKTLSYSKTLISTSLSRPRTL